MSEKSDLDVWGWHKTACQETTTATDTDRSPVRVMAIRPIKAMGES